MLRVIVDTNVLFSGIGYGGLPYKVISAATEDRYRLVLSPFIIHELRTKIAEKLPHPRTLKALEVFLQATDYDLIDDPSPENVQANLHLIPSDPDDVPIALVAIQSSVDVPVTGNKSDFFKSASSELHDAVRIMTP